MAFVKIEGIEGNFFIPDINQELARKHSCRDCYFCQMCGDDRCTVCTSPSEDKKGEKADEPQ